MPQDPGLIGYSSKNTVFIKTYFFFKEKNLEGKIIPYLMYKKIVHRNQFSSSH